MTFYSWYMLLTTMALVTVLIITAFYEFKIVIKSWKQTNNKQE